MFLRLLNETEFSSRLKYRGGRAFLNFSLMAYSVKIRTAPIIQFRRQYIVSLYKIF